MNMLKRWCQRIPRPQTCEICRAHCPGTLPLCAGCHSQLPWIRHGCNSCGEPVTQRQSRCERCSASPLPFAHVAIPLRYAFPVDEWIGAYKYRELPGMVNWLAALLADHLLCQPNPATHPTLVIGVPMHPAQQRKRGYNQSILLARQVARIMELPFSSQLLQKTRATAHQRTLNAATRRLNLQDAFGVKDAACHGQHIALVDDVVTTGATSAEIAHSLLNAGAASVSLWALAKTQLQAAPASGGNVVLR